MENTFYQRRAVKREEEKLAVEKANEKKLSEKNGVRAKSATRYQNTAQVAEQAQVGVPLPAADAASMAHLGSMLFQPHEMTALSVLALNPGTDAAAQAFRLRVEETPVEFAHLYAGLERVISRVSDISIITGNIMEMERSYVLGVTSAIAGEGKTTTALHLAMTVARRTPKRVCLIDLSLGDGALTARLGLPESGEGIVAAIEDGVDVVPCVNMAGLDNLTIVPAGRTPLNPARFVRLPRIAQFLVSTRHAFDVVIVDMPAVATENATPLARQIDGVVMVVRAGVTPRDVVTEAIESVGPNHVNCVILNRAKPAPPKWLQKRFANV